MPSTHDIDEVRCDATLEEPQFRDETTDKFIRHHIKQYQKEAKRVQDDSMFSPSSYGLRNQQNSHRSGHPSRANTVGHKDRMVLSPLQHKGKQRKENHLRLMKDEYGVWLLDFSRVVSKVRNTKPLCNSQRRSIYFNKNCIRESEVRLRSVRSGTSLIRDVHTPLYEKNDETVFPPLLKSDPDMFNLGRLKRPSISRQSFTNYSPSLESDVNSDIGSPRTFFITQLEAEESTKRRIENIKQKEEDDEGEPCTTNSSDTSLPQLTEQQKNFVHMIGGRLLRYDQALLILEELDKKEQRKRKEDTPINTPVIIPNVISVSLGQWSDVINLSREKKYHEWSEILTKREVDRTKVYQQRGELAKILRRAELKAFTWRNFRMNNDVTRPDELFGIPSEFVRSKEDRWRRRKDFYNELIWMLNNNTATLAQKAQFRKLVQSSTTASPSSTMNLPSLQNMSPSSPVGVHSSSFRTSKEYETTDSRSLNTEHTRFIMRYIHDCMTSETSDLDVDKKLFFHLLTEVGIDNFFRDVGSLVVFEKVKDSCGVTDLEYEEFREKLQGKRSVSRFLTHYNKYKIEQPNTTNNNNKRTYETLTEKLKKAKEQHLKCSSLTT